MTDFATLLMQVDATGMAPGEQALDRIAAKGAQAEAKVAKATAGMSKGMKDVGGSAGNMAPQIQNASFQVADFAVQIASGTEATRALAQQMPQLLGGFGMFGALAGAAVAVGGALLPILMDLGSSAEDNKKALDALADAQDALNRSLSIATAPLGELIEKYGNAAARVREMAIMQMQLNVAASKSTLADTIGDLSDATEKYTSISASFYSKTAYALQAIEDDFGLTGDAAWEFIERMKSLESETNRNIQVEKFRDLVGWLEQAGVAIEDMPPEFAKAAAGVLEVNIATEGLAATIDSATDAAGGAVSATDDWAAAMASVNAQLAGAYSLISSIGGGMVQRAGISAANAVLDTGGGAIAAEKARRRAEERQSFINKASTAEGYMPADMIDAQIAEMERQWAAQDEYDMRLNAIRESERAASRKGRSGGGRKGRGSGRSKETPDEKWGDDVFEYQRQTEAFLAQADALAKVTAAGGDWERALAVIEEEQQLLNAAQKAGIELTPEIRAGIKGMAQDYIAAEEKLENMRSATERGQDAMRDLFGSILDGADSAKEALANLLAEIAKVQFSKGMMGLLGQTSWGSGLLQGIGNLLSYDGGGYTGDGARTGGLDGKGGFLAMMHPQETVTDHTKGQSGATSVHVTVGMDESGNLQVRKIAQQEAASMGQAVSASIPGRIQQYSVNPRRR